MICAVREQEIMCLYLIDRHYRAIEDQSAEQSSAIVQIMSNNDVESNSSSDTTKTTAKSSTAVTDKGSRVLK